MISADIPEEVVPNEPEGILGGILEIIFGKIFEEISAGIGENIC